MKKHLSFLTALLLLLSLAACGTAPAKDVPPPDDSEAQTDTPPEPSGTFTPVTTEEEVGPSTPPTLTLFLRKT